MSTAMPDQPMGSPHTGREVGLMAADQREGYEQDIRTSARLTDAEGRVLLAIDGMQPDVGHEVLWVLRDCPVLRCI
jgi:hypothetical protein